MTSSFGEAFKVLRGDLLGTQVRSGTSRCREAAALLWPLKCDLCLSLLRVLQLGLGCWMDWFFSTLGIVLYSCMLMYNLRDPCPDPAFDGGVPSA